MVEPPEIEFDENEHSYSLDGQRVPALTTVLKEMGCTPGFWFLSQEDLLFYQSRGSAVHKAVELTLANTLDKRTLAKDVRPYMVGIDRFLNDHPIKVFFAEKPLIHRAFRYGCRPDIVAEMGRESGVIEVKATSQHGIATSIQTAGQLVAVRQEIPNIGKMRIGLRLLQEEPYYDLRRYTERSDESTWISLLNSYNFLTRHKLLQRR